MRTLPDSRRGQSASPNQDALRITIKRSLPPHFYSCSPAQWFHPGRRRVCRLPPFHNFWGREAMNAKLTMQASVISLSTTGPADKTLRRESTIEEFQPLFHAFVDYHPRFDLPGKLACATAWSSVSPGKERFTLCAKKLCGYPAMAAIAWAWPGDSPRFSRQRPIPVCRIGHRQRLSLGQQRRQLDAGQQRLDAAHRR